MIKAILFDLDGTLLPMDEDLFTKLYIGNMANFFIGSEFPADRIPHGIMSGLMAMIKNKGEMTNEDAFWIAFDAVTEKKHEPFIPDFNEYYETTFIKAKQGCGFNPYAKEIIDLLKEKKIRCILATNPIFPHMATYQRIEWAGLDVSDFELVTTYENSHYCKPNPCYYTEIMQKTGLKAEEVIMVGNDSVEDFAATQAGIPLILATDSLKGDDTIDCLFKGTLKEIKDYLNSIL